MVQQRMSPGAERALIDVAKNLPRFIKAIENLTAELRKANQHYEEDIHGSNSSDGWNSGEDRAQSGT